MNLNKLITKNIFKQLAILYMLSITLFISIRFFDFYRESSRFYGLTKNYIKTSTEQLINEGEILRLQMNIDHFLGINNKDSNQIICPKIYIDDRLMASNECTGLWTYQKSDDFFLTNGQKLKIIFGLDGTHFILTNLIIIFSYSIFLIFIFIRFQKSIDRFSFKITSPLLKWSEWAKNLNLNNKFETPEFTNEELEITEFSNFHKFNQQAFNIQKDFFNSKMIEEKAKIELEIAKSVSHDIRSPLVALKNLNKDISFHDKETKELFNSTTQRIEEIANDLLKKSKTLDQRDFSQKIIYLIKEKLIEYKNKEVIINYSIDSIALNHLKSTEQKLLRIISNLLNNSISAQADQKKPVIDISLKIENEHFLIQIKDNGPGIPENIQKLIGKSIVTSNNLTSTSGSGIGLLNAYKTIEDLSGSMTFKTGQDGTQFIILLPILPKKIVLIDDDKIVHLNWKKEAAKKNISLDLFFTSEDFLNNFSSYDLTTPIFIDKNIDNRDGILLAQELKEHGFKNLFLQTGEDILNCPDFFNEVLSKEFPYK